MDKLKIISGQGDSKSGRFLNQNRLNQALEELKDISKPRRFLNQGGFFKVSDSGIVIVGIGDCGLARSPVKIKTFGLGSCVGITLYDRHEKIGGLVHAMLPTINYAWIKNNPLKFTDSGIEYLVEEIVKKGSSRKKLEAKLVGGAHMFENRHMNIGERNIKWARDTLKRLEIPIVAEDTGKNYGRTITLDTSTGDLLVRTILRGDKVI